MIFFSLNKTMTPWGQTRTSCFDTKVAKAALPNLKACTFKTAGGWRHQATNGTEQIQK